ncbi:MAG: hypothetical protein R3F61_02500 [Myxococcota bacterium]
MIVLPLLFACRAPPEAPADLDSVAAYLFGNHLADDEEVMTVGLEQLRTWFETDYDPDANRGFQLTVPLAPEAVGALDASVAFTHPDTKESRAFEGMGGAAAGTVGVQALDDYVAALTAVEQDVVFPNTFEEWSRTWRLCDGAEFADHGCDRLESDEQQLSTFGLGLRSEGEAYNQYRWFELDDGSFAMNHRNWQIYPPEVSSNLLEVVDQYYLNTFVASTDGTEVFRFQATWAVFGDSVPEDIALNLTANAMFDSSQELEEWLEENDP